MNYVGATISHVFDLDGSSLAVGPMVHRDGIFFNFPSEFDLPNDGSITVAMDGVQMNVYIYPEIDKLFVECPEGVTTITGNPGLLTISNLRHMAYQDQSLSNFNIMSEVYLSQRLTKTLEFQSMTYP